MYIKRNRVVVILLALILGLGIFFRFFNLEKKVFWHDEIYTQLHVAGYRSQEWQQSLFTGKIIGVEDMQKYLHLNPQRGLGDTITTLAVDDPHHPPLYYTIARYWVLVFGDSITIYRLLSAFFSLLAFPAIYWLSLELFSSPIIGWISVALLAVSPLVVLYAQEAREYALWTVIILLANWALLRAVRLTSDVACREQKKIFSWGIYAVITAVSLYTSMSTSLIIAAHAAYILITEKLRPTKTAIAYLISLSITLILFLPWILVFLANFETFYNSTAWSRTIKVPQIILFKSLGLNLSRSFLDFGWEYEQPLTYIIVFVTIILLAYSLYWLCRTTPLRISAFILTAIVVPIALLFLPDFFFGGVRSLSARYFTPAFLGIYLSLSYFIATRLLSSKIGSAIAALLISLSLISCAVNSQLDTSWTKGISYSIPQVARSINQSGSPLVVGNQITYNPGNLFALSYLLKPGVKLQLLADEGEYAIPDGFSDIYLLSPSDKFREKLEKEKAVKLEWVLGDIHLWLWKIKSP
jgi:uncharacterized membrane protein